MTAENYRSTLKHEHIKLNTANAGYQCHKSYHMQVN